MSRRSVFEQVLKHISRADFQASVYRHAGDKYLRTLDCWSWFSALLYGQLTGHDSIRSITHVLGHSRRWLKKLQIAPVKRSTFSDANQHRPLEVLEDTLQQVLKKARYASGKRALHKVIALDSTTIMLCLSLSKWAHYRRGTAGIKLHTALDLTTLLPEFYVFTKAKRHDGPVAQKNFQFTKGTTLVFDRAYWKSSWLAKLDQKGVYFVIRERASLTFQRLQSRPSNRTRGIICDQLVKQINCSHGPISHYPGKLRRIRYHDPDTKKQLAFITNQMDLPAEDICALYKQRWQIEIFFRTLKQNLRIKRFIGTSFKAVKAQILVALIAYVCVHLCRSQYQSNIPMSLCMAIIHTLAFACIPLESLFQEPRPTTRHPPPQQLCLNL